MDIIFIEMQLSKTFDNHRKLLTVHQLFFEGKKNIPATTSWNCLDFLSNLNSNVVLYSSHYSFEWICVRVLIISIFFGDGKTIQADKMYS